MLSAEYLDAASAFLDAPGVRFEGVRVGEWNLCTRCADHLNFGYLAQLLPPTYEGLGLVEDAETEFYSLLEDEAILCRECGILLSLS